MLVRETAAMELHVIALLVGLASLIVGLTAANTETEMSELIYEEQLPAGLYPGNVYRTKLYFQPGIKWLRINLQEDVGNPLANSKEVAMAIHIIIDPIDNTMGSIERNWYDITGTSKLAQPYRLIYGEFPFHEDYVFEIIVTCLLDYYQVQVNGYEKFTFEHPGTTGKLPAFDVIRIMGSPGTVDLCWHKFNQDFIPIINETNPTCNQPVVKSICDDLVCYIFSDADNMYTSTANPVTMATVPVTLSQDVLTSLKDMSEQFCCLEGLIKNDGDVQGTLQLAVDISTELLTWQGNATWDNVNKISQNGPLSLFDRLDDIAQVIGKELPIGEPLTANTPAISCVLEANTLDAFVQKNWSFKPSEDKEDKISIKGTDLANLGFNTSDIKLVIFSAALTNLTKFINYNQQGVDEFIVADIISATLFGPDGQISVPTTFTRRLSDITDTTSTEPREPVCAFWSDFFKGSVSGGWSTQGCTRIIEERNQTNVAEGDYVTCHCNHTTNYAILMRIVPQEDKPTETSELKILEVLTFIGCIVSILVLLLALGFFVFMKHSTLDTERIMIHRHLMGSLLIAMVIFLTSSYLTNEKIPCKIIAVLLHYLYLVVFCWMFIEGVHLYRLIVTVYGSEKQMAAIYYSIGWGVPLLIVGISAAVKWTEYGVPDVACWLNPSHGFIWAFVGPACLIMLMNFVVLFLVVKTTVTMSKACSLDNLAKAKTGLRSSLVLLPMLGITWTIGLITHVHTALEFIFVIFNSFQGLWLVIVCCLLNGEVRTAFKHAINKKFSRFSPTVDVTSSSGPGVTGTTHKNQKPRVTSKDQDTKLTDVD